MAKLAVEMNYTLTLTGQELRLVVSALRGVPFSDKEEKEASALAGEIDEIRMNKHKAALGQPTGPVVRDDEGDRPKPTKKRN